LKTLQSPSTPQKATSTEISKDLYM
jgi:hypothetical protein